MMLSTTDLSIVIVNWNVRDLLQNCIQSIYDTVKGINYEIWIVDNNSSDGSVDMIRRMFPEVKIIANKENLGFSKANNQAIRKSNARYVLLLNPDTVVLPKALNNLVEYMDKNPTVGAAGGKLLCPGSDLPAGARHFPNLITEFSVNSGLRKSLFPKSRFFNYYCMPYWDHNDTRDIDLLTGALMIVRRQVIEEIGILDENLFMYGEDVDWCYRIKKAGWRISFVSNVEVIHYTESSSKQYSAGDIEIESLWSKFYYFRKHKGMAYALVYRMMIAFICLIWFIIWFVIFILGLKHDRKTVKAIMRKRALFLISMIFKPKLKVNL